MNIFARYQTDPTAELQGRWFDMGDGLKVLLARWQNKNFARKLKLLNEANEAVLKLDDETSEAKQEEILIDTMSTAMVLGWVGMDFSDTELAVPYSPDAAKTVLAMKDFREACIQRGLKFENFLTSRADEFAKNSPQLSVGS